MSDKVIAILTSGGDAPGMNAAIRAIVRVGAADGHEVLGVERGFEGLIDNHFTPLTARSVSNIVQSGGTILRTARSERFRTEDGVLTAIKNLETHGVNAIIAIGGDGTFHGLVELMKHWKGQVIGVPGTIDNDLYGSDFTIGFDTAVNTALDSIDRIRDTADSHERFFLVEVMGRWAGFIALDVAIGGGAEQVILPNQHDNLDWVERILEQGMQRGKRSGIVVVSESGKEGGVYEVAKKLSAMGHHEYRVSILGHVQRGGRPTARDRILATKLGAYATKLVGAGVSGVMAGEMNGRLVAVPLEDTWLRKAEKPIDDFLLQIMPALAT